MSTNDSKSRLCRRLRTKGMFIEVEPDPLVPNPSDGFCWCAHTLTCLGPDGKPVDRTTCGSDRNCFE